MSGEQVKLGDLRPPAGSHRERKRLGKGEGSGNGTFAGKGCKGQKSRSGHKTRPWFEGGQMPLMRRIPSRGFTSRNKAVYQVVNIGDIESRTSGERVDPLALREAGLIRSVDGLIKILGNGELTRKIVLVANSFSQSAREKIEAVGGSTEERARV
jgi:large subunit ribosomal protein L15